MVETRLKGFVCIACAERGIWEDLYRDFPLTDDNQIVRAVFDHSFGVFKKNYLQWGSHLFVIFFLSFMAAMALGAVDAAPAFAALVFVTVPFSIAAYLMYYLRRMLRQLCALENDFKKLREPMLRGFYFLIFSSVVLAVVTIVMASWFILTGAFLDRFLNWGDFGIVMFFFGSMAVFGTILWPMALNLAIEFSLVDDYVEIKPYTLIGNSFTVLKSRPLRLYVWSLAIILASALGVLLLGLGLFVLAPLALACYCCVYLSLRRGVIVGG